MPNTTKRRSNCTKDTSSTTSRLPSARNVCCGDCSKKMVVADRLYLLVKTVSDKPADYAGVASLLLILFYTLQLYADFSGFIDVASE